MNKAVQPVHLKVSASMPSFAKTENWWWILLDQQEPVNILYSSEHHLHEINAIYPLCFCLHLLNKESAA